MQGERRKATFTIPETAKLLGISRAHAYELVKIGKIPAIRLGAKRLIIPVEAIERLLSAY
ncbi:DNA binding domain protein, excisionase family [Desulfofarcimen acetoxidans DSM 771]|uniref:DNA binding domain protein, excisionase family n=1 Tax=Desulfofarcimen acetoxidans (strain ATCC 49208 / DSM 771 / KCTC 5769 / VKM B-1644 / 5575) TaxID=485916 RepID=C8VWP2_DESAS|nr:helix-turn-helix domain-containing protein [Desulfofarcimen acetoxidans]ACV64406.1 DNA binding domain protein, excisionase family [Desulfofarcimen acetoxidans DSM 771]